MSRSDSASKYPECKAPKLRRAVRTWEQAATAAEVFMDVSEALIEYRRSTGTTRGRHTDEEHDLRRAAIVFAGAGLDAVVKQVLADAGNSLITASFIASPDGKAFLSKVARALRGRGASEVRDEGGIAAQPAPILLAELLMSDDPRACMCSRLIEEMSAGSFQSAPRLLEVCDVFGLDGRTVVTQRKDDLERALKARNAIVHEMDVLRTKTSSRRRRSRDQTVAYASCLLDTARDFLEAADSKLPARTRD